MLLRVGGDQLQDTGGVRHVLTDNAGRRPDAATHETTHIYTAHLIPTPLRLQKREIYTD